MSIEVDERNPSAVVPYVLHDRYGGHPVRADVRAVRRPDQSTQVYITVADDQSGLAAEHQEVSVGSFTGAQLFGICDKFGNPRAWLELHPFDGQPGEPVRIAVAVDELAPAVITVAAVPGVPMQHPAPLGAAQRFVHLLPEATP